MSKQSRRDLREKKEQEFSERELKIQSAVYNWLVKFDAYFPQRAEPLTKVAIDLYVTGLRHLSPYQLDMACEQSLKMYKFSPTIAEILGALKEWTDAQPIPGTRVALESYPPLTEKEKIASQKLLEESLARMTQSSEPMPGMRWTFEDNVEDESKYGTDRRENGWRPREESWRRELEREARKVRPKSWHAPIVIREPGED
jgi:hypothetical protein